MLRCLMVCLLALLAASAGAQNAKTDELVKQSQYPAAVNSFEIDYGHKSDYREGGRSETYRRITYKGALVRSAGTPLKYASSLDLAAPPVTAGAGDRYKLAFRYEEGTAKVGGGLFEAMGVEPFTLRALEKLDLRGSAFVGGDTDGKVQQAAIGVETPPARIPGFRNTQWSNWLVFGVNAQRQEVADSPEGDTSFGLLTYRAFLGKMFGWRRGDSTTNARKLADEILKHAPDLEKGKALAKSIEAQTPAASRSSVQQLVIDAVSEARSEAAWESTVRQLALGDAQAMAEQPTFAVYAESSGWYAASRPFEGSRFKSLFTLTLDYWFMPQRDDVFLRARYENGHERAAPLDRKNQLLVSVGLKF